MWKKFVEHIKEFWRIFVLEFKVNFGGHRLKMLKFMGILVIPFLYGFIYICAMYDPLTDTKGDLDISFVASDKVTENWQDLKKSSDPVYASLRQNIHDKRATMSQVYNASSVKESDLIKENDKFKEEINKHNVSIVIKPIYNDKEDPKHQNKPMNLTEYLGSVLADSLVKTTSASGTPIGQIIINNPNLLKIQTLMSAFEKATKDYSIPIDVYYNYKKNFVLGFGANNKIAGTPTIIKLFNKIMDSKTPSAFSKPEVRDGIIAAMNARLQNKYGQPILSGASLQMIKTTFANHGPKKHLFDPTIFKNEYQGGEPLSKYGIGLAPLFISIGLWIGALSTTLMITPKTHERGTSKPKAFFAKLGLIWMANIIQVTILFGALSILGFASVLGTTLPLFFLTGFIVSFLFAAIVFSIRCMIPAKITGIFTVTILILFQITASGALFPTYVQPRFFQVLNHFVPFNYSVNALKETLYQPNITDWGMNLFTISLFSITFSVIASIIYKNRKNKFELNNPEAFKEIDEERKQEVKEIESPLFPKVKSLFAKKKKKEDKGGEK